MRISILVASKQVVYQTADGKSVLRGAGLSITNFLRG